MSQAPVDRAAGPLAEWARQQAVALAWPPADSDWRHNLEAIRACYLTLIAAIAERQAVWVLVHEQDRKALQKAIAEAGVDVNRVELLTAAFDDTWLRDTLPISLHHPQQRMQHCNFAFDGWGGKYPAEQDNRLGQTVLGHLHALWGLPQVSHPLVAEGGAIESDGQGRVITTRSWLRARYGEHHHSELEQLRQSLSARELLVIEHGWLAGDDTDGHVDNLVRLVAPDTLVYQACKPGQDPAGQALGKMAEQLAGLTTTAGQPYRLFALPWPGHVSDGQRQLPASYANFLLINDAVLVPQFGVDADREALATLQQACPERQAVGINARALVHQNGGIHCASMQIPLPPG